VALRTWMFIHSSAGNKNNWHMRERKRTKNKGKGVRVLCLTSGHYRQLRIHRMVESEILEDAMSKSFG